LDSKSGNVSIGALGAVLGGASGGVPHGGILRRDGDGDDLTRYRRLLI
jgi:hypothetical protein